MLINIQENVDKSKHFVPFFLSRKTFHSIVSTFTSLCISIFGEFCFIDLSSLTGCSVARNHGRTFDKRIRNCKWNSRKFYTSLFVHANRVSRLLHRSTGTRYSSSCCQWDLFRRFTQTPTRSNVNSKCSIKIEIVSLTLIYCPLVLIGRRCHLTGTISYPYDHKKMPAFVYTFVASSISIYFLTFALASGDCFIMGMCQHIMACFEDVSNMFTEIDFE